MRRLTLAMGLALCVAAPAQAERRVYAGEEAAALKCAWIVAASVSMAERAGLTSTRNKEFAQLYAAIVLQRYVSGTDRQKMAALKAVSERRSPQQTVDEFMRQADDCLRQFPPG
ncbi:hypothetical protein [Mesobacterium pallidum]|uniref:hypothetical protein n=1 Tax=Mesobacterium pallidum TaxID=2872037 RepID=UPI001EE39F6D|nr:hypothetical protein [Mesobacterium pallidum]